MRRRYLAALPLAALALLALPGAAFAANANAVATDLTITWIMVSTVLVLFMQAGFLFLEIGFSRGKNVGAGVAKILINLGIATIAWWALGSGISGSEGPSIFGLHWFGDQGFFYMFGPDAGMSQEAVVNMIFGLAFCAVSLAIVWGTTLERIKFSAYVIYGTIFAAIIYPMVAHSVWAGSGAIFDDIGGRPVLDFAGSSVVHLTGATGALAALLLLGARKGKYGPDGSPRAIPGHSMPIVGLGILILWIGWFGFNAGSTLTANGGIFAEVALNTQLAAAAGVIAALLIVYLKTGSLDVGMAGNGAIAGLVGITAPSGYVEFWAAIAIGLIAGAVVVFGVLTIEKYLDDPVGALSAHGLAGIWGTISVGIFGAPRLIDAGAAGGLWYGITDSATSFGSSVGQFFVQIVGVVGTFAFVFITSYAIFAVIKKTIGLRVSEEEEDAGLDISTHGMYGYPEQFIPQPEFPTPPVHPNVAGTPVAPPPGAAPATSSGVA